MTTNPRDLGINIRAVSSPQQVLNGGPKGATFPGWFLQVQQNEGYDALAVLQLSVDDVLRVAAVLDDIPVNTLARNFVTNAVQACDHALRDELARQLKVAEEQAARIPRLRRQLGLDP